jgi:hypothetical protein
VTREAAIATRRPDASELRLADVLASLADALIVVDADGLRFGDVGQLLGGSVHVADAAAPRPPCTAGSAPSCR